MAYYIMEDEDDATPVKVHLDTCYEYLNRKIDATSTEWHYAQTLEEADTVAKQLVKSFGWKHAECCFR